MKAILLFALTALPSLSYCQSTLILSEVVTVDSTSAKLLFSRAKLFVAENFTSARAVTQLEDDESTTLVIKGGVEPSLKPGLVRMNYGISMFTLKIECKDSRYRYTVSNFYHEALSSSEFSGGKFENDKPDWGSMHMFGSKKKWEQLKESTFEKVKELIIIMRRQMLSSDMKTDNNF